MDGNAVATPSKLVRPEGHSTSVFVVSVSGGKDSTALILALREAGIPARYVFADTKWEAKETYEQLSIMQDVLGITIDRVGVPGGMRARMEVRAGFPARMQRWCTRELKIEPLRAYHDLIETAEQTDTISVLGIRAAESRARESMPVWEYSEPGYRSWGGYIWRPLLHWTIDDVLAIHHRHDMPVNKLYRIGFDRVGCYPCIFAKKEDVRLVAEHTPERIDEIEALERYFVDVRRARNAEEPGRYRFPDDATFFQSREVDHYEKTGESRTLLDGTVEEVERAVYRPMPIREVVEWAQTSRGGHQLPLFREEPDGGCFRWGFCDPPSSGAD